MTLKAKKIATSVLLSLAAVLLGASLALGLPLYATAQDEEPVSLGDEWDGVSSDAGFYSLASNTLTIDSAAELKGFADLANRGFSFEGYTVTLTTDVNLAGHEWQPISNFAGTFDGQGHTVYNGVLTISQPQDVGFFSSFEEIVTVRNLTLNNFSVDVDTSLVSGKGIGLLLGTNNADGTRILNCHVEDSALPLENYQSPAALSLFVGLSNGAIQFVDSSVNGSAFYAFNTSLPLYGHGTFIGENLSNAYASVVKNCSAYNTYSFYLSSPYTSSRGGVVCGGGENVSVENFHTNVVNNTAGYAAGEFDLSRIGLAPHIAETIQTARDTVLAKGFDIFDALEDQPLLGRGYTGEEYAGTLFESTFTVDGDDVLADVWANHGVLDVADAVTSVDIAFDVPVTAKATVNGAEVADANADERIVSVPVSGDGLKHIVIDIYVGDLLAAHYEVLSGTPEFTLLLDGGTLTSAGEYVYTDGSEIAVTSAAGTIGARFEGLPAGVTGYVNGEAADASGVAELTVIPETLEVTIASGTATRTLGSYTLSVWNSINEGDSRIVYRNQGDTEWVFDSNTESFSLQIGEDSKDAVLEFYVKELALLQFNFSVTVRDFASLQITDSLLFSGGVCGGDPSMAGEFNDESVVYDFAGEEKLRGEDLFIEFYYDTGMGVTDGGCDLTLFYEFADPAVNNAAASAQSMQAAVQPSAANSVGGGATLAAAPAEAQPYPGAENISYTLDNGSLDGSGWTLSDGTFKGYNKPTVIGSNNTIVLTLYLSAADILILDYKTSISTLADYAYLAVSDITAGTPKELLNVSGISEGVLNYQFDSVGDHVVQVTYYNKQTYAGNEFTVLIGNIRAGGSSDQVDLTVDCDAEAGTVCNLYEFAMTGLATGHVAWGSRIQPFVAAKEGYEYIGYKLNGGDLVERNGDIFTVTEDTSFEFVFEKKILIEDEKLTDFEFTFTQGSIVLVENPVLLYEYAIDAYPADNTLLITAPYLGQGEACAVLINGEQSLTMQEEQGRYYGLLNGVHEDMQVTIRYTQEGYAPLDYTFFLVYELNMEENLFTEAEDALPITGVENNSVYPFEYSVDLSTEDRAAYVSTNKGVNSSASYLKFTVEGSGVFLFDYYISSEAGQDVALFGINNDYARLDLGGSKDANPVYEKYGNTSWVAYLPFTSNSIFVVKGLENNPYMSFLGTEMDNGVYLTEVDGVEQTQYASGNVGWHTAQITVLNNLGGNGINEIWIGYVKNSSDAGEVYEDRFAIANVRFVEGDTYTIKANVSTEGHGSITSDPELPAAGAQVYAGTGYQLTANVDEGYRFYGWVETREDGSKRFVTLEETCNVVVTNNRTYTAVIEPDGTYTARIGGEFYGTLSDALAAAEHGDTVYLLKDDTVSGALTIPEGVTLILPFSDTDAEGYANGDSFETSQLNARLPWKDGREAYRTLTVAEGATLTVNGTLVVGAVQHYGHSDQGNQGRTAGAYAQLTLDGSLVINGTADVRGRVTGAGSLTVNAGGTLKQPFMVNNYSGGSNTLDHYENGHFPFTQYATVNVEVPQTVLYGGKVVGSTSLFFWGSVTTQDVVLVDSIANKTEGGEGSLIWMHKGAKLELTYDGEKTVDVDRGNNKSHLGDSGVTSIRVFGEITFGEFSLYVYGSYDMTLAMPYTYNVTLEAGAAANIAADRSYAVLPGAVFTVGEGATLNVFGELQVYDGLDQAAKSGQKYPTSAELKTYGFAQSGMLIVNGTLNISDGATFVGIAQATQAGGEIAVGTNVTLEKEISIGSEGAYTDDRATFALSARVCGLTRGAGLMPLEAGKTYRAYAAEGFTLKSYTMLSRWEGSSGSSKEQTNVTTQIDQAMTGFFAEVGADGTPFVNVTVDTGADKSGVVVELNGVRYETDANGSFTAQLDAATSVLSYYTPAFETAAAAHTQAFDVTGSEAVVLTKVVSGVELDAEKNVYTRIYDANGDVTQEFVLNALVSYYGSDAEQVALTIAMQADKYVFTAQLTSEKLVSPLPATVYVRTQEFAEYDAMFAELQTQSGETLVAHAQAVWELYEEICFERSSEELAFVERELSAAFAKEIAASIAVTGSATYGDADVDVSVTFVDGSTGSATAALGEFTYEGGRIDAVATYTGSYGEISYSLTATAQNIARKEITVVIGDAASVYGEPLEELTYQLAEGFKLVAGDSLNEVARVTCAVTVGSGVGNYPVTLATDLAKSAFYEVAYEAGNYQVTARAITVLVSDASSIYGDADAKLSANVTGGLGLYGSDTMEELLSITREAGTDVGSYKITATAVNKNYSITILYTNTNGGYSEYTVSPRGVWSEVGEHGAEMLSRLNAEGARLYLTAEWTNAPGLETDEYFIVTRTDDVDGERIATVSADGAIVFADGAWFEAGTYYVFALSGNKNLTVTAKSAALEVVEDDEFYRYELTFSRENNSQYDGEAVSVTAQVTVMETGEALTEDEFTVTISRGGEPVEEILKAGAYTVTVQVTDSTFVYSESFTVARKAVSVSWNATQFTYNGQVQSPVPTLVGGVQGDNVRAELTQTAASVNAGDYSATARLAGEDAANYTLTGATTEYSIAARAITVTVQAASSVYGEDLAALAAKVTSGEVLAVDGVVYELSVNAAKGSPVGAYDVAGKALDDNYLVTFEGGEGAYTITARPVTVTIETQSSVYGDSLSGLTYRLTEGTLYGSDSLGVQLSKEAGGSVGTYDIAGAWENTNYAVTFEGGTDAYTITARPVTVTIDNQSSVYGDKLEELTARLTAGTYAPGEGYADLGVQLTKEEGVNAGTYAITGVSANPNYKVTFTNGEYEIVSRKVTVSVADVNAVYGDAERALSMALAEGSALGYQDTLNDLLTLTREAGTDAGVYKITAHLTDNENYTVTIVYTQAADACSLYTIARREITVTAGSAQSDTKTTWEALNGMLSYTVTEGSIAEGDDLGIVLTVYVGDVALTAENYTAYIMGGTHVIRASYNGDENYSVIFVDGTLTVTKPRITIDIEREQTFVYSGEALAVFDWRTDIKGYLANATDGTFRAVYYRIEGDTRTQVERIVDAGSYCMVVEIVHPSYEYAEEFTTEESRTFFITVQKQDLSDRIVFLGDRMEGDYVVYRPGLSFLPSVEGMQVTMETQITLDGEAVTQISGPGTYLITATVNDPNYGGTAVLELKVVSNAAGLFSSLSSILAEYEAGETSGAEAFGEIRAILSAMSEGERMQDTEGVIAACEAAYAEYLAAVAEDFEAANDSAALIGLSATLTAAAAAAYVLVRKFVL